MVKVNGPVMSLDASGSLGGTIVYAKWKGRNYVRTLVTPSNPRSGSQTGFRAMFKFLSQSWANLSAGDQATWEALADQRVISPFNAYVSYNQDRWRNFLAPGSAFPVTGGGSLPAIGTLSATAGVRQITLAAAADGSSSTSDGVIIFRDLTTSFTPAISNAIAMIRYAAGNGSWTYVDTPLEPDEYFYNFMSFTDDGNLSTAEGEVSATVT